MIKTVSFDDFTTAFRVYGRAENFSYDGLRALFDYLEGFEESTGEQLELDVIALCCEYTEYESVTEAFSQYHGDYDDVKDENQGNRTPEQQLEWFNDNTTVIEFHGGILVGEF